MLSYLLDYLLGRTIPTMDWIRSPSLCLTFNVTSNSLNGVNLGEAFENLSFLGPAEDKKAARSGRIRYYTLGLEFDLAKDGTISSMSVINEDPYYPYRRFKGRLVWSGDDIDMRRLNLEKMKRKFGAWYWIDTDEDESIVFYEYPEHEVQVECRLNGEVKRIAIDRTPLMADPRQRKAYNVTKSWPPKK